MDTHTGTLSVYAISNILYVWQRYILALFYYKMGDGNKSFELDKTTNECSWERVGCDSFGRIRHISLDSCDLGGPIPEKEIQALHGESV